MPRLFMALDLPQTVKRELVGLCTGLSGARWVASGHLHLTLRFIGEVDSRAFRAIKEGLTTIRQPVFTLRLAGVGCFPSPSQPRVVWAGVEPVAPVVALRNQVEGLLVGLELPPDTQSYTPHVTLARLRSTSAARMSRYLNRNASFVSSIARVNALHLYSSVLSAQGAQHRVEGSYPLSIQDQVSRGALSSLP